MRTHFFHPAIENSGTGCRTDTTEGVALLTGNPKKATLTIMQSLVFAILFAYAFTFIFRRGETGIWWGMVVGEIVGGLFALFVVACIPFTAGQPGGEETPIPKRVAGQ